MQSCCRPQIPKSADCNLSHASPHLRQRLQLHAPPDGHCAAAPHHTCPAQRLAPWVAPAAAVACATEFTAGAYAAFPHGGTTRSAKAIHAAGAAARHGVCCAAGGAAAKVLLLWVRPGQQLALNLVARPRQTVQAAGCRTAWGKGYVMPAPSIVCPFNSEFVW